VRIDCEERALSDRTEVSFAKGAWSDLKGLRYRLSGRGAK
jgi:hypothetical protein